MGGPSPVLHISDVRFTWPGRRPFTLSVRNFRLERGQRLLLTGPSGSGKSTLLSLLTGIVTPQEGRIVVAGTDIARLQGAARDRFRAEHFGIIFQMFNLLPYGSVIDNVILPLRFAKTRRARVEALGPLEQEAERLLETLGLPAALLERGGAAANLSVGQQQRVAAARALIGTPDLIVADEPTSALDADSQRAFLDRLFTDIEARHATLIMVSHDKSLAPLFTQVVPLAEIAHVEQGSDPA